MSASVSSNHNRFTPSEASAWQAEMPAVQSHPPSGSVTVEGSTRMFAALKKVGANVQYTELPA
ncbi:MAG: hypothetical protein DMF63_18555 [Acidobacteria bacterium]|nr:MAG: hypothetical protein DMF63_18555 [Acidobacteriota bacterium]